MHHALYLPIYPSSTFYKYEPAVEIALFSTSICNQGSPTNRTFPPPLLTNTSTSQFSLALAVMALTNVTARQLEDEDEDEAADNQEYPAYDADYEVDWEETVGNGLKVTT